MTCEEFWNREPFGREHLAECAECAMRYRRQEVVSAGLRRLGAPMRGREAPAHVERNLLAAFRGHPLLRALPRPRDLWWVAGAWAAALAVTVSCALLLSRGNQPYPPETSAVGGFIPLPNAERIAPNEPMNLVRLELPRSTMIALGFEVTAERAGEAVEADVMLGADGVARAVRFLE